jgi:hypothetical protein
MNALLILRTTNNSMLQVHLLYESTYAMHCVGKITAEKSGVNTFEFPTNK